MSSESARDSLLRQLGRISQYEDALERHLKLCHAATDLASKELDTVRLKKRDLTNRRLGRPPYGPEPVTP